MPTMMHSPNSPESSHGESALANVLAQSFAAFYPQYPFLTVLWQDLAQAMIDGHDYAIIQPDDQAKIDQSRDDDQGTLPIWVVDSSVEISASIQCDEHSWRMKWQEAGSAPMIAVKDKASYRLYRAQTFFDESAINHYLAQIKSLNSEESAKINPQPSSALPGDSLPPSFLDHFTWSAEQTQAINLARHSPCMIVTGGPGGGKSTTIVEIVRSSIRSGERPEQIAIATPSGKAAERINAALKMAGLSAYPSLRAVTLSHLLGLGYGKRARYNARHPLPFNRVIVDECSMIDVHVFAELLRAYPASTERRLILCGDPHQLFAVDHGEVFRRLCAWAQHHASSTVSATWGTAPSALDSALDSALCSALSFVALQGNWRAQSKGLPLLANAVLMANTEECLALCPLWPIDKNLPNVTQSTSPKGTANAAIYRLAPTNDNAINTLLESWMEQYHALITQASYDGPLEDTVARLHQFWQERRILCAQNVGPLGANEINRWWLAKGRKQNHDAQRALHEGEVLLLPRNTPEHGLANGAIGVIFDGALWFSHPQRNFLCLPMSFRAQCQNGFAMSIHKAQGSEFNQVLLIVPPQARVLSREVLYTGITRAKQSLVLVADETTINVALHSPTSRRCAVGVF